MRCWFKESIAQRLDTMRKNYYNSKANAEDAMHMKLHPETSIQLYCSAWKFHDFTENNQSQNRSLIWIISLRNKITKKVINQYMGWQMTHKQQGLEEDEVTLIFNVCFKTTRHQGWGKIYIHLFTLIVKDITREFSHLSNHFQVGELAKNNLDDFTSLRPLWTSL